MFTQKTTILFCVFVALPIGAADVTKNIEIDKKIVDDLFRRPKPKSWKAQKALIKEVVDSRVKHPNNLKALYDDSHYESSLQVTARNHDAPFVRYLLEHNATLPDNNGPASLLSLTDSLAITDMALAQGNHPMSSELNNLVCGFLEQPRKALVYHRHGAHLPPELLPACIATTISPPYKQSNLPILASFLVRLGYPLDIPCNVLVKEELYKGLNCEQFLQEMIKKTCLYRRIMLENTLVEIGKAKKEFQDFQKIKSQGPARKAALTYYIGNHCPTIVLDYENSSVPDSIMEELEQLDKDIKAEKQDKEEPKKCVIQ